ncbi:MAG: hypothetical protein ACOC9S_04125 [Planctomycetota bacterium]
MHNFTCPHCGTEFEFPDEQAGGVVTCLGCGRGVALPKKPSAEKQPPRPAPRRRGFVPRLMKWLGLLGVVLVAAGIVLLAVSIAMAYEAPVAPMSLLIAGMALILLWFMGYYISLAMRQQDRG